MSADIKTYALQGRDRGVAHVMRLIGMRPAHRPYLWIGDEREGLYGTITNPKTLRRLAHDILRALGDDKATDATEIKQKGRQ